MLFLQMATTVVTSTPPKSFYVDSSKPPSIVASLTYDGLKYFDVQDNLSFGLNFAETSGKNWNFVFYRRGELGTLLRNVILKLNELRKRDGESKVDLIPFAPVVKQSDFTTDLSHISIKFDQLVNQVHTIFGQLKTVVDEIIVREKNVPPAAAVDDLELIQTPVVGQSVMVHGGGDGGMYTETLAKMENALGKWWAEPYDGAAAITELVKFEGVMMVSIGGNDHEFALKRVQALSNFEYKLTHGILKFKELKEFTTAPHHEQALKRTEQLVKLEKDLCAKMECDVKEIKEC